MENKILLYFVSKQFRNNHPSFLKQIDRNKVNFSLLLLKAAQNRVLYPFACQVLKENRFSFPKDFLTKINEFFLEGEKMEQKLKMTVEKMKKILDNRVEYYLFKTIQSAAALPSDLDILFKNKKDYERAIRLMEKAGWTYQGDDEKGICRFPGLVPVEPHLTVSWESREFFSRKFLLQYPQKAFFLGREFNTLNPQAELGIQLAQISFDNQYLVLRDWLAIKNLLGKIKNLQAIEKQSRQFGWFEAEQESLVLIKKAGQDKIELPFWLPLIDYLRILHHKVLFDRQHATRLIKQNYFKSLIFYFWKRGRFFLKRNPSFVDSWLY